MAITPTTIKTLSRFQAIELMVLWEGGVNATRLSRLFGVQSNVISKAITQYRTSYPGALTFNAQDPEKLYVGTKTFLPQHIKTDWDTYVKFMSVNGTDYISALYGQDILTPSPSPLASPQPATMQHLLKAIRLSGTVQLKYKSRNNPDGLLREIMPRQLTHDGLRWHCRAYCYRRSQFADFNIARMSQLRVYRKNVSPPETDTLWELIVDVHIDAHPEMDALQRQLVLNDYGHDKAFALPIRAALVDYTLQQYRLGRYGTKSCKRQHPLIVTNMNELEPYLFPKGTS